MVEWARRAEERGFATLGTIDRLVYPNYDTITALAAAAGATSRIGLFTDILLAPIYPPVWLAKATGSLHAISGGRLTLGLGVGGRADDFAAAERPYDERGRLMDETLELLHRAWAGEPVAGGEFAVTPPVPGGRVPVLVGGQRPRRDPPYGPVGRRLDRRRGPRGAGRRVRREGRRGLAGGRAGGRAAAGRADVLRPRRRRRAGPLAADVLRLARRDGRTTSCRRRPVRRSRSPSASASSPTPASPTSCSTRRSRPWTRSTASPTSSSTRRLARSECRTSTPRSERRVRRQTEGVHRPARASRSATHAGGHARGRHLGPREPDPDAAARRRPLPDEVGPRCPAVVGARISDRVAGGRRQPTGLDGTGRDAV